MPSCIIRFLPSVKGFGWLKGLKLTHALPPRPPYSDHGQLAIQAIDRLVADGQALWVLDPLGEPCDHPQPPRYRATLRRARAHGALWRLNLAPTVNIIRNNAYDFCRKHEFPIDVKGIKLLLTNMAREHGWDCVDAEVLDHVMMWSLRRHLVETRTNAQMLLHCMKHLALVCRKVMCPHIVCTNLSVLGGHHTAASTPSDPSPVLNTIHSDPAHILKYIGFNKGDTQAKVEPDTD